MFIAKEDCMEPRTVLITGAASGIGRATAHLAAKAGYRVVIADLSANFAASQRVAEEISRPALRAVSLQGDMGVRADIERIFKEAQAAVGSLSALVNCAGVYRQARVQELDYDELAAMIAVNVTGVMYCCREAAWRMSTRNGGAGGAIVNVTSLAVTIGGRPGASAYAGSKAAIDNFSTGFAREVAAEGIRVNTVRPGVTATGMTTALAEDADLLRRVEASMPLGRIGQPEEVAELIVWLLSDKASLVTGAHVNAGGGGFLVAGIA